MIETYAIQIKTMQALQQAFNAHPIGKYIQMKWEIHYGARGGVWIRIGTDIELDVCFTTDGHYRIYEMEEWVVVPAEEVPRVISRNISRAYAPATKYAFLRDYIWVDFAVNDHDVPESYWGGTPKVIWSDEGVSDAVLIIEIGGEEYYADVEEGGVIHLPLAILEIMHIREAIQPRSVIYDLLPLPIAEEIAYFAPG